MTATMILREHAGHRASHGGSTAASVSRPGRRLFDLLRQSVLAAASKTLGRRPGSPMISPVVNREIMAIDTFADFMAKHPDMPTEHRARFLRHILRSCEELREAFS